MKSLNNQEVRHEKKRKLKPCSYLQVCVNGQEHKAKRALEQEKAKRMMFHSCFLQAFEKQVYGKPIKSVRTRADFIPYFLHKFMSVVWT